MALIGDRAYVATKGHGLDLILIETKFHQLFGASFVFNEIVFRGAVNNPYPIILHILPPK
jgi:hypothetical protein